MKNELRQVISGKSEVRHGAIIQTIACHLKRSQETSKMAKDSKYFKKEETEILRLFINDKNLWVPVIDFDQYVSEGAEQKVYLNDGKHVLKCNSRDLI